MNSNTFENDFIIALLDSFEIEIINARLSGDSLEKAKVTDKYAVALTAFMQGKIVQDCASIKMKP